MSTLGPLYRQAKGRGVEDTTMKSNWNKKLRSYYSLI